MAKARQGSAKRDPPGMEGGAARRPSSFRSDGVAGWFVVSVGPVASFVDERPASMREDSGGSRLPEHKRADVQNGSVRASNGGLGHTGEMGRVRLGTKPGMSLRDEVLVSEDEGVRSKSMALAVLEWREWLQEARETRAVFEGTDPETGDVSKAVVPLENRFMQERRKALYAKLHDLERGVREAYGKRLTTVMLTFTASNTSGAGDWLRCPANHLDDLLGSWSAVRRQLHRVLDGRRWEYARILEPHKSGYGHVHVAVFVDGPVSAGDFEPVMDAHVEHCLPAASEAHGPETDAVSVNRGVENLAAYLSSYVMKWGEDALEAPEYVQRFNALLWATGRRRWSVSQGAQEFMAFSPPASGDNRVWELVALEVRGAEYPIRDGGEPVVYLSLGDRGRGLDPPPVRE